jgi:hypothetical protein
MSHFCTEDARPFSARLRLCSVDGNKKAERYGESVPAVSARRDGRYMPTSTEKTPTSTEYT